MFVIHMYVCKRCRLTTLFRRNCTINDITRYRNRLPTAARVPSHFLIRYDFFFPLGEHNLARLPKFIRQLFHHTIPAAREISLDPNRSTIGAAVKLGLRLFSLAKEKNRSHRNRYSGCSKYGTDVRHDWLIWNLLFSRRSGVWERKWAGRFERPRDGPHCSSGPA